MFQSLIGRLGTTTEKDARADPPWFQSLIGRLGTENEAEREYIRLHAFQSLIGRLGTLQEKAIRAYRLSFNPS